MTTNHPLGFSEKFKKTILNTYGEKGEKWLCNLPGFLQILSKKWHLSQVEPIFDMSYHYVAKAIQAPDTPVVIKMGCDKGLICNEYSVLQHFHGLNSIKVIAFDLDLGALLLKQAIPGHSLKSLYPIEMDRVINTYAEVICSINAHTLENKKVLFPSIAQWLDVFDRESSLAINDKMLRVAKRKRDTLLSTIKQPRLLHGDLHLENILEDFGEWVVIDPQGVIGEIEFEAAAFDIFAPSEIKTASTKQFLERIALLAKATALDFNRLQGWFFVRLILSAAWSIEDKADPSKALQLAELLLKPCMHRSHPSKTDS